MVPDKQTLPTAFPSKLIAKLTVEIKLYLAFFFPPSFSKVTVIKFDESQLPLFTFF